MTDQLHLRFDVGDEDTSRLLSFAAKGEVRGDHVLVEIHTGEAEDLALNLLVAAGVEDLAELQEDLDIRRKEAAA